MTTKPIDLSEISQVVGSVNYVSSPTEMWQQITRNRLAWYIGATSYVIHCFSDRYELFVNGVALVPKNEPFGTLQQAKQAAIEHYKSQKVGVK